MSYPSVSTLVMSVFFLTSTGLAQVADPQMNARDAFWSAADLVDKKPPPARISRQEAKANEGRKIAAETKHTKTTSQPSSPSSGSSESVPPATVTRASLNTSAAAPLGLRYTLLKQSEGGQYLEVLPDAKFRAGDHVKVSVMANERSYLYIVGQGSSGAWTPLYPQPNMPNFLEPGKSYRFPPKGEFTFDGPAGEDRLFILLTRQPLADLDQTIVTLRNDNSSDKNTTLASAQFNDQFVQRLKNDFASRDLIFTVADSEPSAKPAEAAVKPGDRLEKAMYVVNPGKTVDSKIVVDMRLKHQ